MAENKTEMPRRPTLRTVMAATAGLLAAAPARAAWELNMPQGVTAISREVYDLHMLIFWICVVIGVGVFGVMIYSIYAHRKSRGAKAAQFHESTTVEIVWTVLPFLVLIGMAIPAAGTLIRMEDTRNSDLTIKVTGYQWLWQYEYLDHDVSFFSRLDNLSNQVRQLDSGMQPSSVENYLLDVDNRVVVPVDKKVRILLTSNDVIHAWWVPELGGKKDAIPGYINEMWFRAEETGVYRGQCAELCGRGHGFMPIVVEVVSQEEFQAWVAEQGGALPADARQVADASGAADAGTATDAGTAETEAPAGEPADAKAEAESAAAPAELSKDELMSQGEQVYKAQCAACHQADGSGMAAAGFPAMKGSAVATGDVAVHIDQVLNGKNAMPPYRNTLSDTEIAAVVTYERNAFGNDTGDVIQPADIAAKR
ncbi:cytochrome c oxidase subunit II [Salinisphaera sp. PC39]|uniref:cytochrome c oxidase subunit II n=1 Tax=Salinisphaera sp. PC39 TaxID=1304156 RepID=UPI00333F67F2